MLRLIALATLLTSQISFQYAFAQDDLGKRLIERLEKDNRKLVEENEALKIKAAELEATIKELKEAVDDPKGKRSLSDRLAVGTVVTGQYAFPGAAGEVGTADLTITERDGSKVKGKYGAQRPGEVNRVPGFEFEGSISGNTLNAKSVGTAQKRELKLTLRGSELKGNLINSARRTTATVSFKLGE